MGEGIRNKGGGSGLGGVVLGEKRRHRFAPDSGSASKMPPAQGVSELYADPVRRKEQQLK